MTTNATRAGTGASTAAWKDGKRWLWLLSPAIPALGLTGLILNLATGHGAWLFLLPIVFYGIVPILDMVIGEDWVNAPESAVAGLEQDRYYRAIVAAYIPFQFAATVFGAWLFMHSDWGIGQILGGIITVGMINGVGINTAHELGHKTNGLERWLAKLTLAPVAYGHFFVEHNKGHHKHVATPADPASSRMGETFWAFLPRTMIGSLVSAWNIERVRLERNHKRVISLENENLQAWGMTVVLFGALVLWLGVSVLPFLLAQAFFGAALLEVVNYIEHYGLLRRVEPSGRYERCAPRHSWNSNHVVTNLVLYQLQRHSDHHANPTRRYQALRHFDESPQLPCGYAAMLLAAYIPPLWFALMDRRVVEHHRGDIRLANLRPGARDRLLAKWMNLQPSSPATLAPAQAASPHQCPNCNYVYDECKGCPHEGFPPGTPWSALPADWACPQCAVRDKPDFRALNHSPIHS